MRGASPLLSYLGERARYRILWTKRSTYAVILNNFSHDEKRLLKSQLSDVPATQTTFSCRSFLSESDGIWQGGILESGHDAEGRVSHEGPMLDDLVRFESTRGTVRRIFMCGNMAPANVGQCRLDC